MGRGELFLQRRQRRKCVFVGAIVFPLVACGVADEVAGTARLAAAKSTAACKVLRRGRLALPELFGVDPEKRKTAIEKDGRSVAATRDLHESSRVEIKIPGHPAGLVGGAAAGRLTRRLLQTREKHRSR